MQLDWGARCQQMGDALLLNHRYSADYRELHVEMRMMQPARVRRRQLRLPVLWKPPTGSPYPSRIASRNGRSLFSCHTLVSDIA